MSSGAGSSRGFRIAGATAAVALVLASGCGGRSGEAASGTKEVGSSTALPSRTEVPASTITTSVGAPRPHRS